MRVEIRRIDETMPLPEYKTEGAVAFDLAAREKTVIKPGMVGRIPSNVVIKVPRGYMLYIKDRSSTASKKGLLITAGVIDQDYHGEKDEILIQVYNISREEVIVDRGERIAQGIFLKIGIAEWEESQLDGRSRGGFGTTGEK